MPTVPFGTGFPSAVTPLDGTEQLSFVQGGVMVDGTTQDIADIASAGAGRNVVTALTSTAGVVNINWALGDYFTHTLDENVTSITFSNLPASPRATTLFIVFTQDSTPRTVAWPASFRWAGGTDGVISTGSGAVDALAITSVNQGTTWLATLVNGMAA